VVKDLTQRAGFAGPAAAVLFAASVAGFAAMRTDGYTHGTKAVSELGAVGAPMATAFNVLGFILPGILVIILALALASGRRGRVGPTLLALSGAALVGTGIAQADMAARSSPLTLTHGACAMLSGLAWAVGLFWIAPMLRADLRTAWWGHLTPWFFLFLLANIGWQIAYQTTHAVLPGWGQRIGFAGYFLWVAITGIVLWRVSRDAPASKVR